MTDVQAQTPATQSTALIILLRSAFIAAFILTVILLVVAVPPFIDSVQNLSLETTTYLQDINVSAGAYTSLLVSRELITVVGGMVVGLILFRLGYHQWVVLVYACVFVMNAVPRTELDDIIISGGAEGFLFALFAAADALSTFLAFYLVYSFPDGELHPPSLKWVFIALAVWFPFWLYPPTNPDSLPGIYEALPLMIVFATGMISQVYRYRNLLTREERQQVKLVLYAMGIGFVANTINNILPLLFPALNEPSQLQFVYEAVVRTVYQLTAVGVYVAFMLAIVRFRLWDLDFAIHRTLSYVFTGVIAVIVFALPFAVLRASFIAVLPPIWVAIIATVVGLSAAGAILPVVWHPVNRFVDRQIYKITIDYNADPRYQADEASEPLVTFGDYAGLEVVGAGGMGSIYRGRRMSDMQEVAIKIMLDDFSDDPLAVTRFEHEASILQRLDHPNIVTLFTSDREDDLPYIVMEYIDGMDLRDYLKQHEVLTLEQLKPLLMQIAAALDYAHEQQVVHRDIKPDNVMLMDDQVRVMDFGVATVLGESDVYAQQEMVGTLRYMPPEQIQSRSNVDGRADIYSLGVTVYQLLTGVPPFNKARRLEVIMSHLNEPVPDPRDINPSLPWCVTYAIEQAMAKDPDDRFDSCADFIEELFSDMAAGDTPLL